MDEFIESVLASTLLRTLRSNPNLSTTKAVDQVLKLVAQSGLLSHGVKNASLALQRIQPRISQHGVLNPNWLAKEKDMGVYFYFVNAQAGWLKRLSQEATVSRQ